MTGIPKRRAKIRLPPKPLFAPRELSLLERIDVPRIVCVHLIGENHSPRHRMGVGTILMAFGVIISRLTAHIYVLSFFGEVIGYLIHGIGTIPFAEEFSSHIAKKMNPPPITVTTKSEESVEEGVQP